MSTNIISVGTDFLVEIVDRSYLGTRRTALKISGEDGSIQMGGLSIDSLGNVSILGNVISGALATVSSSQTLTNKTISGVDNTLSDIPESAITGLATDLASKVPTTRLALAGTGLTGGGDLSVDRTFSIDATVATLTGSQVLTNKTVSGASNTISNIAQASITGLVSDLAARALATRLVSAGTGLTGSGSLASDITLALANTAVTAASYGSASTATTFTVDAQGRLTAAAAVSISIVDSAVTYATRAANLIWAGPTTGSPSAPTFRSLVAADLPSTTVAAGSYGSASSVATFTVDAAGRLSAAAAVSIAISESAVTNLVSDLAAKAPTSRLVSAGTGLTGGGDLSADRTFALANTAVAAGSYTYTNITVDAQGRLTAASSGTVTPAAEVTVSPADIGQAADTTAEIGTPGNGTATGPEQSGATFIVTRPATCTGVRFFWRPATTRVIKCSLWDVTNGTRSASVSISTSGKGIYTGTFGSSVALLAGKKYRVSIINTDNNDYTFLTNIISYASLSAGSGGPHLIWVDWQTYALTDVFPGTNATTERYPVEPVFTVP